MKIVAFVPIKLNNERLPGKNTKCFFDGTPLIQCLLNKLVKINSLDEIYVFCSNESIINYLTDSVTFLKRPTYLDTSSTTPQDIMREFIQFVDADIYMISHVTSPFVTQEHLEECINAVANYEYDSSFTATKIQKLLWSDGKPFNFDAKNIPRTQELQPIYAEVSAAYVFKKEVFEKFNRRIGINPYIVQVTEVESIDIDYPEDFEIADAVYKEIILKTNVEK